MAQEYENYSQTSQDYDSARVTYGLEVITGALCCALRRPLKELHILDAGCGTGNFTAALSGLVGKVTGVDLNEGMRRKALEKTAHLENVEVKEGDVTNLSFQSNLFDGVVVNQVIHHLDEPDSTDHPNVRKFMSEAHRVLKPGGILILNTSSPEQVRKSLWFIAVVPPAAEGLAKRMLPIEKSEGFMSQAGFKLGPVFILPQNPHSPNLLQDKRAPLIAELRNTNSSFSLVTPEQLKEHLDIWRQKLEDGSADQFIAECEENRKRIGLTTTLIGQKQ